MKRILILSTLFVLLVSMSACNSGPQRIRMDERWTKQLRELALEIVESEKDFFGDKARLNGLLEVIKTGKQKLEPSIYFFDEDGARQSWSYEFARDARGVFSVEIGFELASRSHEGKLGIGLVDLVTREPLPDGGTRFRMRSIRPRQVLDYVRDCKPGQPANYEAAKGTFSREKRNTALLKLPEDTRKL